MRRSHRSIEKKKIKNKSQLLHEIIFMHEPVMTQ